MELPNHELPWSRSCSLPTILRHELDADFSIARVFHAIYESSDQHHDTYHLQEFFERAEEYDCKLLPAAYHSTTGPAIISNPKAPET